MHVSEMTSAHQGNKEKENGSRPHSPRRQVTRWQLLDFDSTNFLPTL